MTLIAGTEKFEIGQKYQVSTSYVGRNKQRLQSGQWVVVERVETLEEVGYDPVFDELTDFNTIVVMDEERTRFWLRASDLVLVEAADAEPVPPVQPATQPMTQEEWNAPILAELVRIHNAIRAIQKAQKKLMPSESEKAQINALRHEARSNLVRLNRQGRDGFTLIPPTIEQRCIVALHFSKIGIRQSPEF